MNITAVLHSSSVAKLFWCALPDERVPYAVSLVDNKCKPLSVIPVVNNYKLYYQKPKYEFTVCGPIMFNVKDPNELVNMIEISMMFGASHFYFYHYSISGKALEYLKKYQDEGLVDIINWKLPSGVKPYYRAQAVSIIDCQFRNMYLSKYSASFDVDELLVPLSFSNYSQLLADATAKFGSNICAAVFRMVFYRIGPKLQQVLTGDDGKQPGSMV